MVCGGRSYPPNTTPEPADMDGTQVPRGVSPVDVVVGLHVRLHSIAVPLQETAGIGIQRLVVRVSFGLYFCHGT